MIECESTITFSCMTALMGVPYTSTAWINQKDEKTGKGGSILRKADRELGRLEALDQFRGLATSGRRFR